MLFKINIIPVTYEKLQYFFFSSRKDIFNFLVWLVCSFGLVCMLLVAKLTEIVEFRTTLVIAGFYFLIEYPHKNITSKETYINYHILKDSL